MIDEWCHGVCGNRGQWRCTECELWVERHGRKGMPSVYGCASRACIDKHDAEMRGHPAHRWKDLAKTDRFEYERQVFGAHGGPQKSEALKRAEDEAMLDAWLKRRAVAKRSAR